MTAVAGASNHALYDAGGTVYACGQNVGATWATAAGRTHHAGEGGRARGAPVTELVASFANSGALLANGDYFDWGYNAARASSATGTSAARPTCRSR